MTLCNHGYSAIIMASRVRLFLSLCSLFYYGIVVVISQDVTDGSTPTFPSTTTTGSPIPTISPPPSSIPENRDIGVCTCDLTSNACDVDCCCDLDCSDQDVAIFSGCIEYFIDNQPRSCVSSSLIFRENSPFIIESNNPNLLCIYKDNYIERNYYKVSEKVENLSELDKLRRRYEKYSFTSSSARNDIVDLPYYRSGDPIYTIEQNSHFIGKLSLPSSLVSSQCSHQNRAAFLINEVHECVHLAGNLLLTCENDPALDASTYFSNFRLIRVLMEAAPAGYNSSNGDFMLFIEDPEFFYNRSIPINPASQHTCIDENNVESVCFENGEPLPAPKLTGVTCSFTVAALTYRILHNATGGLLAATARFSFRNVSTETGQVTQTFQSVFNKAGDNDTFLRSGNPGYLRGQPVLAGTKRLTSNLSEAREYIELDENRANWLTILTSDAGGSCVSGLRQSVTFGESRRSGCLLQATRRNLTADCALLQALAYRALRGDARPTHVASFGNSLPELLGDWVQVFNNTPPEFPSFTESSCRLVLGLHLDILYANIGSVSNPQPKIIGVLQEYEQPQEITFQCVGFYCQSDNINATQPLEVVSSVGFIDVSRQAESVETVAPRFTARLPSDFFYPFT